jgi:uncharacterized protein YdaU (DUF1376 family)
MKADIWMPLYVADYLADTNRLTTVHHGAYLLLLMDYWRNGALPNDDAILAQITKMSPDAWSIARALLEQFFSIDETHWTHKRVEEELKKAGANKTKAHARAVKAAEARWSKEKDAPSNATSTPQAMLEQCPSPSPSPSKETKSRAKLVTLENFLKNCEESKIDAIPIDDPIHDYASQIKLPSDFLYLGWQAFKNLQAPNKKQADWRATFRTYVRQGYLKVWALNSEGVYYLTMAGKQLERELSND